MQKPFIHFPLQRHFVQQVMMVRSNERLGAGIEVPFPQVTDESLAKASLGVFGKRAKGILADQDGIMNAAKGIDALFRARVPDP